MAQLIIDTDNGIVLGSGDNLYTVDTDDISEATAGLFSDDEVYDALRNADSYVLDAVAGRFGQSL